MKNIALYGGSFNPPHYGHFEMAKHIWQALGVDEVWFLFSINTEKNPNDYAPLLHRMAMADILLKNYSECPFIMTDIQDRLGTHITSEVIQKIKTNYPEDHFIWVMGTDNLETVHQWEYYETLFEEFPTMIINRPPYTIPPFETIAGKQFLHLHVDDPRQLHLKGRGWHFLNNAPVDMASSRFLRNLHNGIRDPHPLMQPIINYIIEQRLYGLKDYSNL